MPSPCCGPQITIPMTPAPDTPPTPAPAPFVPMTQFIGAVTPQGEDLNRSVPPNAALRWRPAIDPEQNPTNAPFVDDNDIGIINIPTPGTYSITLHGNVSDRALIAVEVDDTMIDYGTAIYSSCGCFPFCREAIPIDLKAVITVPSHASRRAPSRLRLTNLGRHRLRTYTRYIDGIRTGLTLTITRLN